MIDMKTAKAVFGGFTGLANIPGSQEAVKLRIDALRAHSRTEAHARRVVAQIRENTRFFPSVQEIIEACENSPDDDSVAAASRSCRYCSGDLWILVYGEYGTSGLWRCTHTAPPPPNIGPRITPALAQHYQQELEAADRQRAEYARRMELNG